jgi:hypothetical protein
MGKKIYVTPAQVAAAKLAVKIAESRGEEPTAALIAIANARPGKKPREATER